MVQPQLVFAGSLSLHNMTRPSRTMFLARLNGQIYVTPVTEEHAKKLSEGRKELKVCSLTCD